MERDDRIGLHGLGQFMRSDVRRRLFGDPVPPTGGIAPTAPPPAGGIGSCVRPDGLKDL